MLVAPSRQFVCGLLCGISVSRSEFPRRRLLLDDDLRTPRPWERWYWLDRRPQGDEETASGAARKGLPAVQDEINPSQTEHSQETLLRERWPNLAHLFRGESQPEGCTGKRAFG